MSSFLVFEPWLTFVISAVPQIKRGGESREESELTISKRKRKRVTIGDSYTSAMTNKLKCD